VEEGLPAQKTGASIARWIASGLKAEGVIVGAIERPEGDSIKPKARFLVFTRVSDRTRREGKNSNRTFTGCFRARQGQAAWKRVRRFIVSGAGGVCQRNYLWFNEGTQKAVET
jgi:hypothetical protein